MRRAWIVAAAIAATACSAEPSFETGAASSAASSSTSSSTAAIASTTAGSGGAAGTGGEGGRGDEGGGGADPTGGPGGGGSSGDGGAGGEAPCGNGDLDEGEDCDVDSALCVQCQLACPLGWMTAPSGTRCFALDTVAGTFFDGASRCAAAEAAGVRARLATPTNEADLALAASLCPDEACWIGTSDLAAEGTYAQIDGTPSPFTPGAPPWAGGQPDDFMQQQDCVAVIAEGGLSVLDDRTCTVLQASICEIVPGWAELSRCDDDTTDPGEECRPGDPLCERCDRRCDALEDGWSESPIGDHTCFKRLPAAMGQAAAAAACAAEDARLATPADAGSLAVVLDVCAAETCWLGATDDVDEGAFTWISGEPFVYPVGEPPWAVGQPDGGTSENCLVTTGRTLQDHPCGADGPLPMCERGE